MEHLTINHEWTRIHTNDRRTLTLVLHCTRRRNRFRLSFIRVDSRPFVVEIRLEFAGMNTLIADALQ
jgi:hypothetical protein